MVGGSEIEQHRFPHTLRCLTFVKQPPDTPAQRLKITLWSDETKAELSGALYESFKLKITCQSLKLNTEIATLCCREALPRHELVGIHKMYIVKHKVMLEVKIRWKIQKT